ncbi:MAG: hypothetical protein ABIX37_04410 [Gammaproteobacteria bacterium]
MFGLIDPLNSRVAAAASGRNVLLVFVAAAVVFSLFNSWLVPAFQAATGGMYPIDMSFPTTPAVIYDEYSRYTEQSRQIYHWFVLVDFIWPPLLATFFAIAWTWLARRSNSTLPQRMIAAGVLLLPFAEALLDLLENAGFLTLLEAYPTRHMALAWATSLVKHTKLVLYLLCWLVMLLFLWLSAASALPGRQSRM